MNASALATRTAIAIQNIEAEVARLGVEVKLPSGRADVATKQCLTLEAIAAALRSVEIQAPEVESAPVKSKPKAKRGQEL